MSDISKEEQLEKKRLEKEKEFISQSTIKHNNKYSYDKVHFQGNSIKVIIICPIHDEEFQITPHHHLTRGQGCRDCGFISSSKKKIYENGKKFIEKAIEIHGNKYDYSKVKYVYSDTPVIIICKTHKKEFLQTPYNHLKGKGCRDCSIISKEEELEKERLEKEKNFITESVIKHNNKYSYDKVYFQGNRIKVIIICPIHDKEFQITPHHHLTRGQGCRDCGFISSSKKQSMGKKKFIEKAVEIHGNKYDYSKVEYVNSDTNVIIICKKHKKEFSQIPYHHLNGKGCRDCGHDSTIKKLSSNSYEFIKKAICIHSDYYDYSKVNYINNHLPVIIICPIHDEFPQQPNNHLQGKGCPYCINKTEGKMEIFLKNELNLLVNPQFKEDWTINQDTGYYRKFDFCLEEFNLMICVDGPQHYNYIPFFHPEGEHQLENQIDIDIEKMIKANEKGYSCIRIPQPYVWDDKNDWKKLIKQKINKYENPTNIFLDCNNEYNEHRLKLLTFENIYSDSDTTSFESNDNDSINSQDVINL